MKRIKKPGVKKESPKYLKAKKLRKNIKKSSYEKGNLFYANYRSKQNWQRTNFQHRFG